MHRNSPPSGEIAPAYFVSHGTAMHTLDPETASFVALREEGTRALREYDLKGVVVLSAHWMESSVGVGENRSPTTIHDHPASHLYNFKYAARGDATLSAFVAQLLRSADFDVELHPERGLDHGAWLALELLFPGGTLPVVPVSLPAVHDGDMFLRFGEALAPLRENGIVVVCSGAATHNQDFFRSEFMGRRLPMGGEGTAVAERGRAILKAEASVATNAPWSVSFDSWLTSTLAQESPTERNAELLRYSEAPGAVMAHPEPSHFWPVLVFSGLASLRAGSAAKIASGYQFGLSMSAFRMT